MKRFCDSKTLHKIFEFLEISFSMNAQRPPFQAQLLFGYGSD